MWYKKTTFNVDILARPIYKRSESSPKDNLYVWSYDIDIVNNGKFPLQLLKRHWTITDADKHTQEIHGTGVLGIQPIIEAHSNYQYKSFAHLPTSYGKMTGTYEMRTLTGQIFRVEIPLFKLELPVRLVYEAQPSFTEL